MKPIAYVFGYGSLMYPNGINERGMRHKYIWEDLSLAEVIGYSRGMFAAYANRTFYGMMKNNSKVTNGVLMPIFSEKDLNALWMDEGVHKCYQDTKHGPMYKVQEISNDVWITARPINTDFINVRQLVLAEKLALPESNIPIFALINTVDKSSEGMTSPWYISHVWKGIKPWGEEFRRRFVNTGGIRPGCVAKVTAPIYNLCKLVRHI